MLKRAWTLLLGICLISIAAASYAADANPSPDAFQNLKFRNLGPASAGPRLRNLRFWKASGEGLSSAA